MDNAKTEHLKTLGELEQRVMDYVWARQPVTAEAVRGGLAAERPMKDSTVRTILRRLEEKGYVTHLVEGRTYVYSAREPRQSVAGRAVGNIVERLCGGSVEELLVGMVEAEVLDQKQLEELAAKIARAKERKP